MDLLGKMNMTIEYIENNLTTEIDYQELAKIAVCSSYHFQRMFSFIAGVPLSEYIRRRKLTLAAFDLQNTTEQVIDIAFKYGYESPEAFSRAFKNMHGAAPTSARRHGVKLKAFPPISFQISIKGDVEMNYRIEELKEFEVIGISKKLKTENPEVAKFWEEAFKNNLFEKLWEIRKDERYIRGILGVLSGGDWGKKDFFTYTLGIITDLDNFEGMEKIKIPESTWVVFEVEGIPDNLIEMWKRLYTEWLPSSIYELADIPAIECYLPIEENKNELWIPVIKKNNMVK